MGTGKTKNNTPKKSQLKLYSAVLFVAAFCLMNSTRIDAITLSPDGTTVGATYYGGHYSPTDKSWVIDNNNQCTRIEAGEFTAESLNAIKTETCADDNGLGYLNDIPLHNQVSYAELSSDPSAGDFSALGGLSAGTKLEIKYGQNCVIAEKRDVGYGGGPVNGNPRAIDLWWQTARSLGFTNGFDAVTVKPVDASIPLTPVGQTTTCSTPIPVIEPAPQPEYVVEATPTPTTPEKQKPVATSYHADYTRVEIPSKVLSSITTAGNLASPTRAKENNTEKLTILFPALAATLLVTMFGMSRLKPTKAKP